jgi:nucleotide-binding universal stress UspA family protein
VSTGLVHHAHCPVAVIHDDYRLMPHRARAPVLVGIDGSPTSELATAIAFDEASRRQVGLIALHAWSDARVLDFPGVDWSTMKSAAEEVLAERLAGWQERYPDVNVDRRVVCDRPARQLIEHATRRRRNSSLSAAMAVEASSAWFWVRSAQRWSTRPACP